MTGLIVGVLSQVSQLGSGAGDGTVGVADNDGIAAHIARPDGIQSKRVIDCAENETVIEIPLIA